MSDQTARKLYRQNLAYVEQIVRLLEKNKDYPSQQVWYLRLRILVEDMAKEDGNET
jgi:hypothetical protein